MKNLYLVVLFISSLAYSQDPFITTWQVQGTNLNIVVPVFGNSNSYTVNFGDGTILNNQTGQSAHTYAAPGTYTVALSGNFTRVDFYSSSSANKNKLLTVQQWGDTQWTSMDRAFYGCSNVTITATDTPNLNQVANMREMFREATSLNQSLNAWDVSNVTNMRGLFHLAEQFNQPLDNWDVSNVTTMESMFSDAYAFNQNLNGWNVSNVTNMKKMFAVADDFNQPLNAWDVSIVTNMEGMFDTAISFNQPIGNWNVLNVVHMRDMFNEAAAFNQPLNSWNVSSVTATYGMFSYATSFNQPLNNWDMSNVTNMDFMFLAASAFNGAVDSWDVSNVSTMASMFSQATAFNQPLNDWDVANVADFGTMFAGAEAFNQPLNNWEMSGPNYLFGMLYGATSFNQNLSNWDYSDSLNFSNFVTLSGLDTTNYDALLLRFLEQDLQDKMFDGEGLTYCNALVHDYLTGQLNWNIYGDTMDAECSGNTIAGTVLYDQAANGCDFSDMPLPNFMVGATSSIGDIAASGNLGSYTLTVFDGSYNVALLNMPDYFTVTPETTAFDFSTFGNSEELNFCIVANQTVADLSVTILPLNEVRPGFESHYQLVIKNMGTQTVAEALVNFTFDPNMQTFISSNPAPGSTESNQLHFILNDLMPFESRFCDITMQTYGPSIVDPGDIATSTATVSPNTNDFTPQNNSHMLEQVVVNAFDPNDIQVLQGAEITLDQTDEYLDYIIRFQNLGTASAVDVRIEEALDQQLDWTTLTPVSASDNYHVEIVDGNNVKFIFEDIFLPHQAADDAGSTGFIAYKIKPLAGRQIGDIMSGNASIYFDFNTAVVTNTVNTEVVTNLSTDNYIANNLKIYPNPVADLLFIQTVDNSQLEEVTVYNLQGRKLLSLEQNLENINVSELNAGVYFVNVRTNLGSGTYKMIKN